MLGAEIKKRRKAFGLKQWELGEVIGVDASAVSKIERGATISLKPAQIKALCDLFHCTPSDLYGIETLQFASSEPLTQDQQELLMLIPMLNAEEAKALLEMVKAMFGYKKNAGL